VKVPAGRHEGQLQITFLKVYMNQHHWYPRSCLLFMCGMSFLASRLHSRALQKLNACEGMKHWRLHVGGYI
jgi:hypothetical protein